MGRGKSRKRGQGEREMSEVVSGGRDKIHKSGEKEEKKKGEKTISFPFLRFFLCGNDGEI